MSLERHVHVYTYIRAMVPFGVYRCVHMYVSLHRRPKRVDFATGLGIWILIQGTQDRVAGEAQGVEEGNENVNKQFIFSIPLVSYPPTNGWALFVCVYMGVYHWLLVRVPQELVVC